MSNNKSDDTGRIRALVDRLKVQRSDNWRSEDYAKLRDDLSKIEDDTLAAELAKEAADSQVRFYAVTRLANPVVLREIAKTDRDHEVRLQACTKLGDPAVLADFLVTCNRILYATGCVRDLPELQLALTARRAISSQVRRLAVAALQNQVVLGEIARTDADADVRRDAVSRLTDQTDALAQVLKAEKVADVRLAAVRRLTDRSWLQQIARSDENEDVRKAAAQRAIDGGNPKVYLLTLLDSARSSDEKARLIKAFWNTFYDGSGNFQACACGYPVSVSYGDGSHGPIFQLVDSEADSSEPFTTHYQCPRCGHHVATITS